MPEPAPAVMREVKTTLRSADDFGLRPSSARPDIRVPVSSPTPHMDNPPSVDSEYGPLSDSQVGSVPSGAKRLIHTIRMSQQSGPTSSPLPPPAMPPGAHDPGAGPMLLGMPHGGASTVPLPSRQPFPHLPPTINDLPQIAVPLPLQMPPPKRSLLSGKIGMLLGFLAGMLITAVVVAAYLFLR
jgi:serine/threonine-protein kinase